MSNNTGEKILWFVAGAGIGTGVAFLLWTRSGKRARKQMGRMVEQGRERIAEAGEEILHRGQEFYERGKEFVEDTGKRVSEGLRFAQK